VSGQIRQSGSSDDGAGATLAPAAADRNEDSSREGTAQTTEERDHPRLREEPTGEETTSEEDHRPRRSFEDPNSSELVMTLTICPDEPIEPVPIEP
jgi:hypothetical protein